MDPNACVGSAPHQGAIMTPPTRNTETIARLDALAKIERALNGK